MKAKKAALLNQFQPIGGNEGDGDGTDAVDLDDDAAALLDATDGAGTASELTIGDTDGLAGTETLNLLYSQEAKPSPQQK